METDDIKELIVWMKKQKVQHFKINGVEVTFSPMALVENYMPNDVGLGESKDDVAREPVPEDLYSDPMLYASTR